MFPYPEKPFSKVVFGRAPET